MAYLHDLFTMLDFWWWEVHLCPMCAGMSTLKRYATIIAWSRPSYIWSSKNSQKIREDLYDYHLLTCKFCLIYHLTPFARIHHLNELLKLVHRFTPNVFMQSIVNFRVLATKGPIFQDLIATINRNGSLANNGKGLRFRAYGFVTWRLWSWFISLATALRCRRCTLTL